MKKMIMIALVCLVTSAYAREIQLGSISLSGSFTGNPLYDFNNPGAQPFGQFGVMTVQSSSGIFGSVHNGDTMQMSTPSMFVAAGLQPVQLPDGQIFYGTLGTPMVWSIGGFTINTLWDLVAGPMVSLQCVGLCSLSGHGPQNNNYTLQWDFSAPFGYNGPIDLEITFLREIPGR